MKKIVLGLVLFVASIVMVGCASLKEPYTVKNNDINLYKYAYVNPTSTKAGVATGYYYSAGKTVNPADIISGFMIKRGFIILPQIENSLLAQTLIVNYGESGRRNVALGLGGYTIEVTIQFIDANTKELIFSSTAEGIGSTEADDINMAITRAMSALFSD